ncbi:MAG: hypothetical protein JSR48_01450 [Verrucomicrobia bacterium]|nr:hypothetical protein [Verrucomicrobiota bacterium]
MKSAASFDVFDTVVTRDFAHPRDLFVHVGAGLRADGISPLDPLAFAMARWDAELAARRESPAVEVTLDEIYAVLARTLRWDPATLARARERELATEGRHLHGVPRARPLLAAARASAGPLMFLSDMYLPSAVLGGWLAREGVMAPGDLLFISGETRANKSSGRMFEFVRDATGMTFGQWHHTGDHPFADVAKPRELGLTATHFADVHLTARERRARATDGEFAPPWRSLLAGAMRRARLDRLPATEREAVLWETGTAVAGPLFHGFVRWTLAEAERRGLKRLYFLARDGQIFWRIARQIQAGRPAAVECRYLYASRLAFAGPAELESPAALRWLAAPTGHFHSLRQTLLQLGLDEAWGRDHLPAELAVPDLDANLPPATREALADWLLAPSRRQVVREAVAVRAARARAYLAAEGLRAGEPVGLVDAGWLGSIQRNLEQVLAEDGRPAPLTGFYLGLMPPADPRPAGEMLGFTNLHAPIPLVREESHKVLVELMAQSDHGQVLNFREAGGRWEPVLNAPGPVNLDEIRLFQEAILAFVRRAEETADAAAAPPGDFARAVIALYRDFHDRPSTREARVFGFLPHADQLYEQRHATLCADFALSGLLRALRDYRLRPPHWWIGGQIALGHGPLLRAFRGAKRAWWRLRGRAE